MKELELYLHIPFCIRKCAYCDFLSFPSERGVPEWYVDLLCEEILSYQDMQSRVVTIFFGGGTPSLLAPAQTVRIFEALNRSFSICADAEITMEANPGTVDREKLEIFRQLGGNRLSFGLQSVHDGELRMLGRIHTWRQFRDSWETARTAGFENMNLDLISAIPGQTTESWGETLETVLLLKPEHISAYSLIIEPGTPFYEYYGEDGVRPPQMPCLPGEEVDREMYHLTKEVLQKAGYERYEISNYARAGYKCRHNLGYWRRQDYLGIGLGASSCVSGRRFQNPTGLEEYRNLTESRKLPGGRIGELPCISRTGQMEEMMFLGLRMMEGVSGTKFQKEFGVTIEKVYGGVIEKMKRLGVLEEEGDRIRLTDRGMDVSNAIFVDFLLDEES